MDIRFCSVCNESIPDGEFEAGRAVAAGDACQHVACALKRSVELGGWRSWLTFGLALVAVGIASFLLVVHLMEPSEPPVPTEVPAVVEARLAEELRATETRLDAAIAAEGRRMKEAYEAHLDEQLALHGTATRKAVTTALDQTLASTTAGIAENLRSMDRLVIQIQQQMADLVDWKVRIQREADQLRRDLELAKRREPAKPPEPQPTEADPKPEAEPREPARDEERLAEIERWRKRLRDPDENIVFTATIQLAQLDAIEATPDLVRVLVKHDDFYARLGAATALGEIQAADAVPELIDALDDKDELVRTAASEALIAITGQDYEFVGGLTKNERIRIMRKYRKWWRDNETEVRRRLDQPADDRR